MDAESMEKPEHPFSNTEMPQLVAVEPSPDQVRCSWCQGSLATVACPSCFATIFTGMKHCPWCGAEVAKAEPLKQIAEACPHCQTTMTFVHLGASQFE
jgi:hypothetical protein